MAANTKRYVIIGASAAGLAAAGGIRSLDRRGRVTVLSDESDSPYFRPMIPFLISGKKRSEDMTMIGQGPYRGVDFDLRLNSRVQAIDARARTVELVGGERIGFDKLLIATGSRPYVPPDIKGTAAEGVYALRTLADARAAERRAGRATHAVMLGGGLLNLKAAFALLERGLQVTLIVRSAEVLSQLMEPRDAFLIRSALDRAGLKIQTGASAERIVSKSNGVCGVVLDDGRELACEMVCIGKGVYPNVDFIDPERLQVDRGVVVDRYTATGVEGIHAAGDVAVTFDPISGDRIVTGLWTNAVEMGRCAGFNMAGRPTEYTGTFGILNATQVADEPFVSMGVVHTAGTDYETHVARSSGAYRKIVFSPDGSRLVGVLLVGDIAQAGLYRFVIREKMALAGIKAHIVDHTLHYGHFL